MAFASPTKSGARVVVLGGGNGTSRLLTALLPLLKNGEIASLHALIHMADDGGSTGRLREQYEVGAMGDLTKCLMALSKLRGDVRGEELLQALNYRFLDGDFKGHTMRNILLTVFELTSHDIDSAIAIMARLLQIPKYAGVIPTTLKSLTQQMVVQEHGQEKILGEGQFYISWSVDLQAQPNWKPGDVRVAFKEKQIGLNPRAQEALQQATHVIVAPGHTIGTILPTLASPGLAQALAQSKAALIVVMTLLTTPKQTTGWSGEDFVRVYESYVQAPIKTVIANNGAADVPLVAGQDWVKFADSTHEYELIQESLVSTEKQIQGKHDVVPRAIAVHDAEKLRVVLVPLLK